MVPLDDMRGICLIKDNVDLYVVLGLMDNADGTQIGRILDLVLFLFESCRRHL